MIGPRSCELRPDGWNTVIGRLAFEFVMCGRAGFRLREPHATIN